jgi:hypothetical protein
MNDVLEKMQKEHVIVYFVTITALSEWTEKNHGKR